MIGAGRAGMIHALNFRTRVPFARLVAVAEPCEETRADACKRLEIFKGYGDYRQVLEDDEVDAVVVVTPTAFHRDIVVACAKAGKHILCEKPMAMNENECGEMIEAANAGKVKLQIGFMRRFDESFIQAKRAVESGEIGDVVLVKSNTRGPSVPQPWMYDINISNGPLAEVNSHDIDTLRWFTGSEFKTVFAIGNNFRCPDAKGKYPDFYDNVILNASFANGMQGSIDGAQGVEYGYDARVEILGTKGCIFLGQVHGYCVAVCNREKGIVRPAMDSWRKLFRESYLSEDIAFIESILEGSEPKATGFDGKMAVRVVQAGNTSIKEKRVVELS